MAEVTRVNTTTRLKLLGSKCRSWLCLTHSSRVLRLGLQTLEGPAQSSSHTPSFKMKSLPGSRSCHVLDQGTKNPRAGHFPECVPKHPACHCHGHSHRGAGHGGGLASAVHSVQVHAVKHSWGAGTVVQ